ncbi:unnamed protein product [Oikopleura dioica]|uniref:Peptidase S1 domain-containing protein n=1 Tax=Oikopleura dioica TaxID=34765 RepID=E4XJM7_OIKDI|nr:unnamed protein product [Oikopleura dioica]
MRKNWGRPVNIKKRKTFRGHQDCPVLVPGENMEPFRCNGATCLLVCKDGFVPIGRKRVACRNRDGELNWTKTTGKCVTCDPLIPQPTKLTCTCPRGNCQWKEKRRSAPWEDFTCRTPQTAAPATSENEFKTGPERLTSCGGSILNDNWIITVAHCCEGHVKVREFEIETERTSDLHIHPLYRTRNYKEWDACLVKFPSIKAAAPQTCENCFSSACLPEKAPSHGEFCWVAGWGYKNEGFNLADSLQEVGVNLYNSDYCTKKSVYGSKLNIESELCAGTIDEDGDGLIDGGKDACQGDSGGPLVCNDGGKATLYGVVSWGEENTVIVHSLKNKERQAQSTWQSKRDKIHTKILFISKDDFHHELFFLIKWILMKHVDC